MQTCAKQARGDDTHTLKDSIVEILRVIHGAEAATLSPKQKSTRGFKHELTGRLLCPAGQDWNDPEFVIVLDRHIVFLTLRQNES